jgi:hypothetical protein
MAASASDALRSLPRSPLWSALEGRDGMETRVHADRHHHGKFQIAVERRGGDRFPHQS